MPLTGVLWLLSIGSFEGDDSASPLHHPGEPECSLYAQGWSERSGFNVIADLAKDRALTATTRK